MTTTRHIAIDPGIGGAIALLIDGEFGEVVSMPVEEKKSGKRQVDVEGLIEVFNLFAPLHDDDQVLCLIESVSAMPGQGVSSMFSLGDSFGTARAVASRYANKLDFVSPAFWKSRMKLTKSKKYSLTLARRKFPEARQFLSRAKDEGRAEALLLAQFAATQHLTFKL